ncbi:hypothetical protein CWO91_19755 [Bradyrhizobium genosp. SA-3]|nr:hypothetical protein CWO91_19755 [Bradyrhizobium genosp. SA-3]
MPPSDWTRMAITSGVAATAMAFLAIDAAVDVSPGGIAKRLEVVQASLTNAAVGHHQLAFAVRAWARGSDQTRRPAAYQSCIERHEHRPQPVGIDRGV